MENKEQIKTLTENFAHLFEGFTPKEEVEKGFESIVDATSGYINLDQTDIQTTLSDCKEADLLISFCQPEEIKEVLNAQKMVLESKHPDRAIHSILVQLAFQPATPLLMEHTAGMAEFFSEMDSDVDIVWGVARDLEVPAGEIKIVLLAGF